MTTNNNVCDDTKRKAQENFDDFKECREKINDLGQNKPMLTNIEDMKNRLNKLKEDGRVSEGDLTHDHLKTLVEDAIQIQVKTDRSSNDIVRFFSKYENFNDIYINQIQGGEE